MNSIPDELQPALQGAFPSNISTCSLEGEPNIAFITETFFVDESHIALSRQFFNKTIRNMLENPKIQILVIHPVTGEDWRLTAEFVRSETEGDLFDAMSMQLEAIASQEGMEGVYHLLSADICEIVSVERCNR